MFRNRIARNFLLASAAVSVLAACATPSHTVTRAQETTVSVGTTESDVRQRLGPPALVVKYGAQPGPSWIYYVDGAVYGTVEYDVDFDANGLVRMAGRRSLPSPG